MPQTSQTNPSGASLGVNPLPAFAQDASIGQDISVGSAVPKESRNSLDQNEGEGMGYLLKLIASLESCNTALLSKLNQAEKELAELRKPAAHVLPRTASTDDLLQTYGWERKLTRMGWKPPP